jgi:hypothetical protein
MPPSADNDGIAGGTPGQALAVVAESLFLANLLLAPGICFAVLAWLWLRHGAGAPPLARQHLRQAFFVSLWGGLLIVSFSAIFIAIGGLYWEWTWVLVIMYFTCIHSTLVLLGAFGLAKALAGQVWRYPLIGPRLEQPAT